MSRFDGAPPFYDDTKQDQVYCSRVERLEYPPHFHEQAELLYVVDGEIEISVNGTAEALKKDGLAVIFPQRVHFYSSPEYSKTRLITFPTDLLADFYDIFHKYQPVFPFIRGESMTERLRKCISDFYSYIEEIDGGFAEDGFHAFRAAKELRAAKGYLQLLLCHTFDSLGLEKSRSSADDSSVLKCIRFITDNYRSPIKLGDVADAAGISRVHTSRIFSNTIGVSFPEYLNMLRLNYAARLCETTDMSATDICYESGFESLSTFYFYFKKKYASTPKAYKKR